MTPEKLAELRAQQKEAELEASHPAHAIRVCGLEFRQAKALQ